MPEPRTLKDWRELRGFTVEELAAAIGQEPERVERWEEIGWDWEAYTREGDAENQAVIGALFGVLKIKGGIDGVHASPSPEPGQYVVNPAKLPDDVLRYLHEHADKVGLRLALPSRWGPYLKEYEHLEPTDFEAILAHGAQEMEHSERMSDFLSNVVARMGEHRRGDADKIGDVFEERGGKLVPKQRPEDQE